MIKYIYAIILGLFGKKSKAIDFFPFHNMASWINKQPLNFNSRLITKNVYNYPAIIEIELRIYLGIAYLSGGFCRVEYTAIIFPFNQFELIKNRQEIMLIVLRNIAKEVL